MNRRWIGLLLLAGPLVACGAAGPRKYTVEDLGIPRTERSIQARAVLHGKLLVMVYETKGEGRLLVADLASGRQQEVPLPGTTGGDDLAVDPAAGRAYIGTSRKSGLWSYDAASGQVTRVPGLDEALKDESYVWSVALGPDGKVYAGTYPGGLLLEHDPKTGRSRSLGAPLPGRKYLRNLVVGSSGRIYCGLGTPGAVVSVDPRTSAVRRLYEGDEAFVGEIHLSDGRLCDGAGRCHEVGEKPAAEPSQTIEIDHHGRFRVETGGARFEGTLDLSSKQDGMMTMGLGLGPDGRIYGGTYYNSSLFVVDPATGRISALGRVRDAPGEFRIFQELGGSRMLLPGYGGGPLFLYELDEPWSEAEAAPNPRKLGEIGKGQHLATSSDRLGDLVAIGTPPDYGRRGGAVTIFEANRLRWRTYTDLVPEQAVQSLCFGPRDRLYVGTSTDAGPGADPAAGSAHLLVLDPATGRVERDVIPVPRATTLNGLVPVGAGRLLGGVETGELFVMDAASGEVHTVAKLVHIRALRGWKGDGSIVGIGWRKGLFRVDPKTLAVEWIPGSPALLLPGMAEDAAGRLYVHDGTRVYRVTSS